jgi:hypothetical protein
MINRVSIKVTKDLLKSLFANGTKRFIVEDSIEFDDFDLVSIDDNYDGSLYLNFESKKDVFTLNKVEVVSYIDKILIKPTILKD